MPSHAEPLTGRTFGRWTVLSRANNRLSTTGITQVFWTCRCACGVEREVRGAALRAKESVSCGCWHSETMAKRAMRAPLRPFLTPPKETDRAYLAGLIDGEGCITKVRVNQNFRAWRVAIFNTDKAVMDWLCAMGGNIHWRRPGAAGWKSCAQWHVSNARDMIALLTAVAPYLIIKKAKAIRAIAELTAQVSRANAPQLREDVTTIG